MVIIGMMMTVSTFILQGIGHHGHDDDHFFFNFAGDWSSSA